MFGRLRSGPVPLHRHSGPQLAIDGALVALAYFLAYRLRFDQGVPDRYQHLFEATIWWVVPSSLVIFVLFRMEQKWWRYVGQSDYLAILEAVTISTLALAGFVALTHPVTVVSRVGGEVAVSVPTGVLVLFFLLSLGLVGGARFLARTVYERPLRGFHARSDARRVLIVGAGDGGRLVLREIMRNPELGLNPVGFVDDDPTKRRIKVEGVRVLGTTGADLPRILDETEPDEVIIAIPSAPGTLRGRVVGACRARGIPFRTLPTVFELLQGADTFVRQVRDVRVEDVL